MQDAKSDASHPRQDGGRDSELAPTLAGDPFERVLGRGRGASSDDAGGGDSGHGDEPSLRAWDGAELFRRFAHSLVGSDLSTGEFRMLLANAGVFALRGSLHTSKDRVRPLVIASAKIIDLENPVPMALVLCELDAGGRVKSALVFAYDSEVTA